MRISIFDIILLQSVPRGGEDPCIAGSFGKGRWQLGTDDWSADSLLGMPRLVSSAFALSLILLGFCLTDNYLILLLFTRLPSLCIGSLSTSNAYSTRWLYATSWNLSIYSSVEWRHWHHCVCRVVDSWSYIPKKLANLFVVKSGCLYFIVTEHLDCPAWD